MPTTPSHDTRRRTLRSRLWLVASLAVVAGIAIAALWRMGVLSSVMPPQDVALDADLCVVAPPTPYDPASGLGPTEARPVPPDARCPVCGMFPARSLDWAAQIIFEDGDAHFFDSPLSLFMYLQDIARYGPGRKPQQIVAQYVTDAGKPSVSPDGTAQKSRWIDARTAFYVHGSSAKGPMRAGNLPAFASREAAQEFAARRGGVVLTFDGINASLIASLSGRRTHDHQ
ncbi:MAG: copper chaperone NosL [Pseudomonadota bacterium]|jgi:copper chaperone NosL|nr:copper chaperone NosL [Pseudomonadota bacterium]